MLMTKADCLRKVWVVESEDSNTKTQFNVISAPFR